MVKHLFCFGVGFSGLEILHQAKSAGFKVSGCTLSTETAIKLSNKTGYAISDINNVDLTGVTHIVTTVPTNGVSDDVYDKFSKKIKKITTLKWFGYLSTTGVYGNTNGKFVNETSPLNPTNHRGKQRVIVEKLWQELLSVTNVFRLAGIYGLGCSAIEKVQLENYRAIKKEGQVFGRIHNYDVGQVIVASCIKNDNGQIYNVCDAKPSCPVDVLHYACNLQGLPNIPVVMYENAEITPMQRSFYDDNRRVENNKIKDVLGVKLRYPAYEDGLSAILKLKTMEKA